MRNNGDPRCNIISAYRNRIIFLLALYCLSGTLLTVVNKFIIKVFPYTNLLLVVQNSLSVILLILFSHISPGKSELLSSFNLTLIRLWTPLVLLFVMMLTSSLSALIYVSVPTVIVMRNLTSLFVAILEYTLLGKSIDTKAVGSLIGMILGAIIYAKHDLTFSIQGYIWLGVNIIATSMYQIYIKKIIDLPCLENVGSIGMSYYNNIISLPLLLIVAWIAGEFEIFSSLFDLRYPLETKTMVLILLSGSLGFVLSISALTLNKLISATSIMVANNANKFSVIVLSEILVQSTLDMAATIGAALVLVFGWLYSRTGKAISRQFLVSFVTLFVVASLITQYRQISTAVRQSNYRSQFHSSNQNATLLNSPLTEKYREDIAHKKRIGDKIYESYLPLSKVLRFSSRMAAGYSIGNTTDLSLPRSCVNRNASVWKTCTLPRCTPFTGRTIVDYPRTTEHNEDTADFIDRLLEIAWGSNPPSVDLYLRSGCHGIMELKYLFESIELFWPRFLGSVIVVLDAGDEIILKYVLPSKPKHHYVIRFECTPCLPGRVFNQYSYLNLDRYSTADYIVTVDSDCIFHSPVTPDLIFRDGRVILASSRTFQRELWNASLDSMMGAGMYDGHYMVTQPVTFALSTFSSFRDWFYSSKGRCYEDQLSHLSPDHYQLFCWMCQLGTYLERGKPTQSEYEKYWFQHMENATLEPILRYAIHVSYEPYHGQQCKEQKCYEKSANEIIRQGLCRVFSPPLLKACPKYSNLYYINRVTFLYANTEIQAASRKARKNTLRGYLERLSSITMMLLDT